MAGETKSLIYCGDWRLDREIGRGAYGVVYLAEGADGAWAAVKVCRRDEIGEERYARELRGARLYSAIPLQEGLVRMREFAEKPWGFYVVMDLADDEFDRESPTVESYRPKTLASVIVGEKALPLGECIKLGISLAKGLVALQRHHLLHRDIKPGNVIYVGGRQVLSDPGLVVEESAAASLVGTPGYVPPEKFTDAASDVYSLGLTLKAASFGRSIEDIDKGPALEADTSAARFPAWWRILNKATDPTPSRRYQSAKALLKELEGLRRKMRFAAIVESTIAKVALVLALLGAVAVLVANVVAGRRAEDEIARRSAENRALKDDMARQSEENRSLKDDLARQSEESRSLRDDFAKQLKENKVLHTDLARQSEENKKLKDGLARQAVEIKALKQDIANRPVDSKALTDKEVESIKKFKSEMDAAEQPARLVAIWNDASTRFGNLGGVAKSMIDYWSITQLTYVGNNSNLKAAKEEFSAIEKKSTENASRFQELKKIAEEKYNTGLDITEETEAVKAIAADEDALKKRVLEIMRSIYGKDWQPSPMDKSSFRL
jgi:serine/threonine protein kinase